jgi:hypothetical protein
MGIFPVNQMNDNPFQDALSEMGTSEIILMVVGLIIIILLFIVLSKEHRCNICGLPFRRIHYNWKIGGQSQRLCPKCNQQMERKVSKKAFKSKF